MNTDKQQESPIAITHKPPSSSSMADKENPAINQSQKTPKSITGLKLKNLDDQYIIKKPIGTSHPRHTIVYSASLIPGKHTLTQYAKSTTVAMKLIKIMGREDDKEEAEFEVKRNRKSSNTLRFDAHFVDQGYFCVVFPYEEVVSLRSLLPENGGGQPENCIKNVLRSTLFGLISIHALAGEMHREVSGGNVFWHCNDGLIKLAFAASVYDPYFAAYRPEIVEEEEVGTSSGYLAMKNVTKWGRAPEIIDTKKGECRYVGFTQKSDIWNVGIVALELAYGEIRVRSRRELLDLAKKISTSKKLPSRMWEEKVGDEELKENEEKLPLFVKFFKGIVKRDGRFSSSFGKMVSLCLASDPEKRPRALDLLAHKFFKGCENSYENVRVLVENAAKIRERDCENGVDGDEEGQKNP